MWNDFAQSRKLMASIFFLSGLLDLACFATGREIVKHQICSLYSLLEGFREGEGRGWMDG